MSLSIRAVWNSLLKEAYEPDLAYLLSPPGQTAQIGQETGKVQVNGISRFVSPQNSYRYVYYVNGTPISALQVMRKVSPKGKWFGKIANVYTDPNYRRQGYAEQLLAQARRDFDKVDHSKDLSTAGSSWASSVG